MGGGGGGEGLQRQDKTRDGGEERRDKSQKTRQFTAIRDNGQSGAGFNRQKAAKISQKGRFLTDFCAVIFFEIVRIKMIQILEHLFTLKRNVARVSWYVIIIRRIILLCHFLSHEFVMLPCFAFSSSIAIS